MENEQHHYELRSRSRSRSHTPLVPNRPTMQLEVTEHHYDLRNKSRERSHTPGEVTSSRRSGSRSLTGSSSKMHEKSMETIEENKEGSVTGSVTDNQSTKSDSSATIKKAERRSERQKVKRRIFQDEEETEKEMKETKERKERKERKKRKESEDSPHRSKSAYKIYKQAGEWWNVFPKTDYTYAQSSQCRYEIAPGVLAMPNMSRRPIHSQSDNSENNSQTSHKSYSWTSRRTTESGFSETMDTVDSKGSSFHSSGYISQTPDSTKSSAYKKTYVVQYMNRKEIVSPDSGSFSNIRKRFFPFSTRDLTSKPSDIHSTIQYDSDSEMSKAFITTSPTNQKWRLLKWFTYLTTLLATWSKKTVDLFKFRTDERRYYSTQLYHSYHESKWNALKKSLDHYMKYIYIFFVRIFLFDTWLLSRFTGIRNWLQKRNAKILWITLLPLFFVFGAYIAQEHYLTCVDFLRDVQRGVTETTYRIFNDITTRVTSFDYELFTGYIAKLKKYFVDIFTFNLNFSLPEMPPIGWNIK